MYRVSESIEFCYGHRLLRYKGKCAHLHGHNGRVDIELSAPGLNEQSMVADFSDIGRIVKEWIDQNLDHRMLLHKDDPLVPLLRKHDEPVFEMDIDPTAEAIARVICDYALSRGLPVSTVRLWETPSSIASYSPSPSR
jgi:6-pyruvoyltetrahydropterin/6-carboxytetrahydropterin synthase